MKKPILVLVIILIVAGIIYWFYSSQPNEAGDQQKVQNTNNMQPTPTPTQTGVNVTPISHATMVLNWAGKVIYTDPTGGAAAFSAQPEADIILVTDIHGDHLSTSTLSALAKDKTNIVAPKAVVDLLPEALKAKSITMVNGQVLDLDGFKIEAIPMYNVPESATAPHTKGRGNGYVVESSGERVYIAGDTGNTPEMRALIDIDLAFVPMNLPYTMSVEDAANAVLAFKPTKVTPYHYRGQDGLSDTAKFMQLVNQGDPSIEVELLNFYPGQ